MLVPQKEPGKVVRQRGRVLAGQHGHVRLFWFCDDASRRHIKFVPLLRQGMDEIVRKAVPHLRHAGELLVKRAAGDLCFRNHHGHTDFFTARLFAQGQRRFLDFPHAPDRIHTVIPFLDGFRQKFMLRSIVAHGKKACQEEFASLRKIRQ